MQNIWASIYAFLCPKNRPRKDLTSFTKTDSKWITGVNVKFKTINLLKENIGEGSYAHHLTTKTEKNKKIKKQGEFYVNSDLSIIPKLYP